MKIVYSNTRWQFFYITEQHIQRLSDAMENFLRDEIGSRLNQYWTVQFSNGKIFEEITTENVVSLANGSDSKIVKLELIGTGDNASAHIIIENQKDAYILWFTNSQGKENLIDSFQRKVEEISVDMKPWWSFLSETLFSIIIGILGFIISILVIRHLSLEIDLDTASTLLTVAVLIASVCVFVASLLHQFIFPRFSCLVGEGVKRANQAKNLRSGFFTIASTSIVGIILSFFI